MLDLLTPETIGLLLGVGMFAGFVDAIAGGGGLICIPALMAIGLPPAMAIATNKAQAVFGTGMAVATFARAGQIQFRSTWLGVICAGTGAAGGAVALQFFDARLLEAVIPLLLIAIAIYFLAMPKLSDRDSVQRISYPLFAIVLVTALGFYDGFFGPGGGSFYTIGFVALQGFGLRRATANAKLLNLTSNLVSLAVLAAHGSVVWPIGLVMAAGQLLGGWLGSHAAIRFGARLIRPLLVVVSLAITLKLLSNPQAPLRLWFERQASIETRIL